jgi:hypothetical protein
MKNKLILSCMVAILGAFSANAAPKFQNIHLIEGNTALPGGKVTLIKTSQRWTADTVYILDRLTFVEAPAVLTIEPGTIVRMEQKTTGGTSVTDPADVGTLIICRGAKIVANGTAESPIIFTNIDDPFVPGGEITIPNRDNGVTLNSVYAPYDTQTPGNNGYTKRNYDGTNRFNYDSTCGGVIILGRTPVAFGAPTRGGGNLQVNISNAGDGYELESGNADPGQSSFGRYSISLANSRISPNLGFAGNLLFDQHGSIKRVIVNNGGKYSSSTPPTLTFTGTAAKKDGVTLDALVSANPVTAPINYSVEMESHPDNDNTFRIRRITMSTTKSERGYGFAGAAVTASTENQIHAPTLTPVVGRSMIQVVATAAGTGYDRNSTYTVTMPPFSAATLSHGTTEAPTTVGALTATVTTDDYIDPSASPIRSGIGANFIEGFQTIDGNLLRNNATLPAGVTYSGSIYGGSDDNDNSGTLRFVSIRYGGFVLSPNNEINGLTCGAVGRGTSFEFIEVVNNADDDIEHFAGSVDMKYVAGLFGGDDGLDLDQGYRGRIQFAFQIQDNTSGTSRPVANAGDCLGEWDGPEAPTSSRPFTVHTLFNFTGIGHKNTGTSNGKGINYKDNSGGKVFNSIFAGAKSGIQLTESSAATATSASDSTTAGHRFAFTRTSGGEYNLLGVTGAAGEPDASLQYTTFMDIGATPATALDSTTVFVGVNANSGQYGHALINSKNNSYEASTTTSIRSIARVALDGTLDPRLKEGVAIRNNGRRADASGGVREASGTLGQPGYRAADPFYTQTQLRGAFRDCNWLSGWSLLSEWGLLSSANVAIPAVKLTRSLGVLTVSFTPTSGVEYVIETSADGKKFTPFRTVTGEAANVVTGVIPQVNVQLATGTADSLQFVRVMPL